MNQTDKIKAIMSKINEQDVAEADDSNFGKPATMMKASSAALKTAKKIVQKQADKNVISQAKIAGTVPSTNVNEAKKFGYDAINARFKKRTGSSLEDREKHYASLSKKFKQMLDDYKEKDKEKKGD